MSVLLLVILAIAGGIATTLLARQRRAAFAVGLATGLAVLIVATYISAGDTVPLADAIVGGSDGLRTLAIAWAASTLLFGVIEVLVGHGPEVLGPSLIGLGVGAMGLSVADSGIGLTLLTASGVAATIVPIGLARGGADAAASLGPRFLRPVLAAGLLSLLAVAWGASPVGPFSTPDPLGATDPALQSAMGLGLLAIAGAVLVRSGAIPAHAWAARFTESMPASAVPPVLGWGAAAFTIVALGWLNVTIGTGGSGFGAEQAAVTIVAVASIVLAGLAAILHDDLEHVLAYTIVQDAGIALLAFASSDAAAIAAGRTWLLAAAAVTSGLAAFVLVMRATFGGAHHLADLGGWARRAPGLGVAFGIVAIGAIGLPGMAAFGARGRLIELSIPGPLGLLVLLAAFAPVVFLGRILIAGVGEASEAVRAADHVGPRSVREPVGGWATDPAPLRMAFAAVRLNRFPLAAGAVILAAVVGLGAAAVGLGTTTTPGDAGGGLEQSPGASPGASPGPSASGVLQVGD